MGFRTIAARGRNKEQLARSLGAVDYIDSPRPTWVQGCSRAAGAQLVLHDDPGHSDGAGATLIFELRQVREITPFRLLYF